jgi:hypothetical protein
MEGAKTFRKISDGWPPRPEAIGENAGHWNKIRADDAPRFSKKSDPLAGIFPRIIPESSLWWIGKIPTARHRDSPLVRPLHLNCPRPAHGAHPEGYILLNIFLDAKNPKIMEAIIEIGNSETTGVNPKNAPKVHREQK